MVFTVVISIIIKVGENRYRKLAKMPWKLGNLPVKQY